MITMTTTMTSTKKAIKQDRGEKEAGVKIKRTKRKLRKKLKYKKYEKEKKCQRKMGEKNV